LAIPPDNRKRDLVAGKAGDILPRNHDLAMIDGVDATQLFRLLRIELVVNE
jgi:hypothetical protein